MQHKNLHTLYIALPKKVHTELFKIYKSLSNKYTNEYLDEKYWVAHISIGKLVLEDKDSLKFVNACADVLTGVKPFPLTLSHFKLWSGNKFIFLSFKKTSTDKIYRLREKFLSKVKPLNKWYIPDKYKEICETFTKEEKKRLKETASPYAYIPHISIVKLQPEEGPEAIKELKNVKLQNEKFPVNEFQVSVQTSDPNNQFPVLKRFYLK